MWAFVSLFFFHYWACSCLLVSQICSPILVRYLAWMAFVEEVSEKQEEASDPTREVELHCGKSVLELSCYCYTCSDRMPEPEPRD